jgi:hypothetical protein
MIKDILTQLKLKKTYVDKFKKYIIRMVNNMNIREVQTEVFSSWDEYFNWHATKSREDNFRDCGLSDYDGKIKAEYIELF